MTRRADVPVAGGRLATFRLGAEVSRAAEVLAIHGLTSTSRTWLATARAVDDRAALIAPDLRGRGRSNELPAPFGVAAHVRDMVSVLDHLGLDRPVVVGHSLGAYIAARLAGEHPDRIAGVVLLDGGLTIPGSERADPEPFMAAFLGPTVQRLKLTYPDRGAYRAWWREHPAVAGSDIDPTDLDEYADHDLVGAPPSLRSSVNAQVVRDDGLDLCGVDEAGSLSVPAVLLVAPRGMVNDRSPMHPLALARAWEAGDPAQRRALQVPDVNHYTIAWGRRGAEAVAAEITVMLSRIRETAGPGAGPAPPRR